MKILFVFNFVFPDYLADCVYHGLVDSGFDVYETHHPKYMLNTYEEIDSFVGKGFTLYGKLNHTPKIDPSNIIEEKIKQKFYDIVIYGCTYTHDISKKRRCLDYLDLVKQYYPRNRVHFLDGADDTKNFAYDYGLGEYGIIWKRELRDITYGNPISFAIPESQILKHTIKKTKVLPDKTSPPIPYGCGSSLFENNKYTFNSETEYYLEYAISYYAHTCKKMGWDCMRHYEILANKTIPFFIGLEDCPSTILVNFPKNIILETNKYAAYARVHPQYEELNEYIFSYTKKNLTTKRLVERFL